VARPGGYPITTNDAKISTLQALSFAGSTNKTSLPQRARLIRKTATGTQEIPLQIASIEKGKARDIDLKADDVIFVPFSWMKNMALSSSTIAASASSAAIYTLH
jgi:polysaccharide biosynthesis/export protein